MKSMLGVTPLLKSTHERPLVVLSDGLGQDSTAIRSLLLEDAAFRRKTLGEADLLIMTSDTGLEHRETNAYRERMQALCAERGVEYLFITPDQGHHSPAWQTLHTQWERNHTIQAAAFPRTCSVNLKLGPIYRALNAYVAQRYGYPQRAGRLSRAALYAYAQDHGRLKMLIGFSKGEERRVKPPQTGYIADTTERVFPLIDQGLDRQGCQSVTRALGHEVPYPSNCQHCPFHRQEDLLRLHRHDPASFERWAWFEARKLAAPKWAGTKNHTVYSNGKTLWENLEAAQRKFGGLSTEELDELRMSRGHVNTTAF